MAPLPGSVSARRWRCTIFAHARAMITGWEEVADEESVNDWEYKT